MKILAIDLSSPSGSIALLDGGVLAGEYSPPETVVHSTWLPGGVRDFLLSVGCVLDDIDIFATTVGPGTFTGTRVAVSTIKGFAWALGRKVYGASALKAAAYNIETSGAVCTVLDARRGEVYAAIYRRGGSGANGALDTLMEERVLTPEALFGEIERIKPGPVVFTGGGLKAIEPDTFGAVENCTAAPEELWPVRASVVARMALEDPEGALSPELLTPVYLRKPGSVFKKSANGK